MKLILIGIQGAGKSTQGNLLSKKYGIPYLSTGHILRNVAKEKTKIGRYIKETINAGVLAPDDIMVPMVEEYLNRPEYEKGYILDGFPRNLEQVKRFKNGIDKVIYLKITDREALWRLAGRDDSDRNDNTIQALKKRIDLFHEVTEPVADYYKKKGRLFEINGSHQINVIFKTIVNELQHSNLVPKPTSSEAKKKIVAIVGLPGAGKTQVSHFFKHKGAALIRFGEVTEEGLRAKGLEINEINEKAFREKLRADLGMAAYAIKADEKIKELLKVSEMICIDGLRSWEEYEYLKKKYDNLYLLAIFASPNVRYRRLKNRKIRGMDSKVARQRDIAEILNLHMGPPIALSDYLVKNEGTKEDLHVELEKFLAIIA